MKISNTFYAVSLGFSVLILSSCASSKKGGDISSASLNRDLVEAQPVIYSVYRAAETQKIDLIHTKLRVKFDLEKTHLLGQATLTFKPYFYPITAVDFDAKGLDIHEVALDTDYGLQELKYSYNDDVLSIELDKQYSKDESINVFIDYTAKPNDLETKGSSAISDAKGLYFINPDGTEEDKPTQIWTQGETESSSCWFPTVDSPNERMTQELYITVDNKYVTLSNGTLQYSTLNEDDTRTDYWKLDLPHAPYLTMMAVGEFSIVKDQWREIEVNYYVEKEYEKHAKMIFGNTPEMLQFYSNVLGVDYPWDKYAQIVVRDYVSGAMENTTAVIHGEFLQKDEREYLDETHEDIIAHELFHHWFGDLVTCESWANLPLNESFATYGEYLWNEYKYGRDEADYALQKDLDQYLWSATKKKVDLIRFNYDDKDDMFDSHSYAKGGRVLHMLRKYVGDEAFFESLRIYLEENKYKSVEIHHVRLAFEKVTGEDLNWFFNQWFLSSGHPHLFITYDYIDSIKTQTLTVSQAQKIGETPLYYLPVEVDIYVSGEVTREKIVVDSVKQTFSFKVTKKPDLVNFDAEKMLLCTKKDYKSKEAWIFQYNNAPLYLDRFEALDQLKKFRDEGDMITTFADALKDKNWNLRAKAIKNVKHLLSEPDLNIKDELMELAENDVKSDVRATAVLLLSAYFDPDTIGKKDPQLKLLYQDALSDKSYEVMGQAVVALAKESHETAFKEINTFDDKTTENLLIDIAEVFASYGEAEQNSFFIETYEKVDEYDKYNLLDIYSDYLIKQDDNTINLGLELFKNAAMNQEAWWARLTTLYRIEKILEMYNEREEEVVVGIKVNKKNESEVKKLEIKLKAIVTQKEKINSTLATIKEEESDKKVLLFWDELSQ
ncbi:MAG: alanyl aminopeptidase [Bacteroidetes bacterium]|nr:MAG: alanyl aminopeptidase [Bacteroidota bacterium]